MNIRTEITDKDVVKNMLEIALYLAEQKDDSNDIEVNVNGLYMHFETWTIKESDQE